MTIQDIKKRVRDLYPRGDEIDKRTGYKQCFLDIIHDPNMRKFVLQECIKHLKTKKV